jgi:hypothetical protein
MPRCPQALSSERKLENREVTVLGPVELVDEGQLVLDGADIGL